MDTTGYAGEVLEVTQRLSELQQEMEAVNREFSGQANSLEALQKKHELLQQILEKQAEKQEILTRTLREAEQSQAAAGERTEMLRQALSEAEEQIARTNQEISNNERYMREAESAADHCATSINRYGEEAQAAGEGTEKLADSLKKTVMENLVPKVSDMAKELASGAFEAAKGMEQGADRIRISTDLSESALKKYQEVMGEVYQNNYGDSFDEVAEAISQVVYHMGELDGSSMQEITENAFVLKDTFEMDVNDTLSGASALMEEMGESSEKAFGLIVSGAQKGLNRSGDMLDKIAEYSPLWGKAGFSAEEMFSILENGLDAGASDLDTVNEFVEEFISGLSDGRVEKSLSGFSEETQKLFGEMKAGEATAAEVFQGVINDLSSAENQQKALTAAGNIWSNLEEGNAQRVITSLGNLNDSYGDVKGKMNELKEIQYDDLDSQIAGISRTIQMQLGEQIRKILPAASDGMQFISENLVLLESAVAGLGTTIAILKISSTETFKKAATGVIAYWNSLEAANTGTKILMTTTEGLKKAMSFLRAHWLAVTVGISAAIAVYVAFSDTVKSTNETINKSREAYEELSAKIDENRDTRQKNIGSVAEEYSAYKTLASELYAMTDAERVSTEGKAKAGAMIDTLNEKFSGLNLQIDETTGKLNMEKGALDEVIESMKEQAMAEAAQDALKEVAAERIDLLKQQQEANDNFNDLWEKSKTGNAAEQSLLNGQMKEQEKVIQGLNEQIEKNSEEFDRLSEIAGNYTVAAGEATDATEEYTETANVVEASTEAQKKALQSLKEKYEEIRGSIEQSMEQKISLFDEFDGGETIGLDKIKENLDSQLTGLTNWRDNMAQLAGQVGENISAELYNHLVELGPDAANIVQEMVNSLDSDKGDGGEQLKQIAERYSELLDIKESAAENIADVSFIIQSALGEISEASALDFENLMTSLDEAKEKASEKGLGISEGLEESFHATVETLRECGAQIPEGLAEALANGEITIEDAIGQMQGSIEAQFSYLSGIAQKAGIPIPEGIREGIVQGGDAAIQAMNQLMGLLTGAQEEGRAELRESSCKSGEVIGDGAAQGAEDSSAKVSQEAADIAKKAVEVMNAYKDSFKNAGYNMMSKFASGLNEGSELVYSKIREIRQRLENEVNNLGKKNTSSKPSQTGGTKPTAKTITPSLNQAKQDDTIPFSLNGDMPGSSLAKQSGEIPLFSNTPNLNTSKVSKKFRQTVKKKIKSGLAFGVQKGNGDKDGKELAEQVAERTEKFIEENAGSYAEANVVWKALLKKAKGSKIEGYEKNIKKLVSEQRKKKREEDQKYGASGDALEEYKKVRDVSAKAEVEYWEIVCSQYKKGTEERLKADKNYLEALKTYNEKWKDLKDDYLQKCQEINEQLEKERQEEYDSAIQNRKSAIRSAFGLFDAFHSEADAPEVLLANMQSQAAGYALWMTELEKLEKKGILNEAFLEELREMGPGGAATILSLGRMTDEQLKKANETYEQLDNLAEEQARREVERQESQTQKRIAELEKAAEEEKKRWYEEYKAAEQELSQPIDESLKKLAKKASAIGEQTAVNFISQLRSDRITEEAKNAGKKIAEAFQEEAGKLIKKENTVGDQMISGILKGMDSHLSIRLGAEDMVAKIEEEIKKSAEINSPSRRFRRTIGVQIPAGVAEGIEENTQTAARAGTYMVGTMLEQAKEKLGEQQMTLTGEMQRINGGAGIAALNHLASENVGGQANVTVNNSGVAEMLGGVMAEMKAIGQEIRYMKVVLDTGEFVGAVAPAMGDELARQAMRF